MTGTAGQKRVPNDYFAQNPFPLPPIEEQKRIVAKVDELMRQCDALKECQQARSESGVKLMNAAVQYVLKVVSGKKESQRETARALSLT